MGIHTGCMYNANDNEQINTHDKLTHNEAWNTITNTTTSNKITPYNISMCTTTTIDNMYTNTAACW